MHLHRAQFAGHFGRSGKQLSLNLQVSSGTGRSDKGAGFEVALAPAAPAAAGFHAGDHRALEAGGQLVVILLGLGLSAAAEVFGHLDQAVSGAGADLHVHQTGIGHVGFPLDGAQDDGTGHFDGGRSEGDLGGVAFAEELEFPDAVSGVVPAGPTRLLREDLRGQIAGREELFESLFDPPALLLMDFGPLEVAVGVAGPVRSLDHHSVDPADASHHAEVVDPEEGPQVQGEDPPIVEAGIRRPDQLQVVAFVASVEAGVAGEGAGQIHAAAPVDDAEGDVVSLRPDLDLGQAGTFPLVVDQPAPAFGAHLVVDLLVDLGLGAGGVDDVVVDAPLVLDRQGQELLLGDLPEFVEPAVRNGDAQNLELPEIPSVVLIQIEFGYGFVFIGSDGARDQG